MEFAVPEPRIDPPPDEAPGGVDAVQHSPEDFPLATPDQPSAAQLDDDVVPDEIQAPEETDDNSEEASEPSA
jgi:hypothetical protein